MEAKEGGRFIGEDFICFLGTGGARFVVSRQLRSSAGTWFCFNGTQICLDPGPGTLVRCFSGENKLNPEELDAVILTHRHLDLEDAGRIITEIRPRQAFITHFGTSMLDHDPPALASMLASLQGCR